MAFKLPGVDALGKQVANAAKSVGKSVGGNLVAPLFNIASGNGGYARFPNGEDLGNYAGQVINDKINNKLREFGSSLTSKIGSKIGQQLANQLFGNLMSIGVGNGTIRDLVARQDPHLLLDWRIIMPALKGQPALDPVYVEAADYASPSLGQRRVQMGTSHINFPSYKENAPVSLVLFEDVGYTTSQYLTYWRSCIRMPDGTYNYPTAYKYNIDIFAITPDGKTIAQMILVGCYPDGPASYPYASDTGSAYMRINQTFACDHVAFIFNNGVVNVGALEKA